MVFCVFSSFLSLVSQRLSLSEEQRFPEASLQNDFPLSHRLIKPGLGSGTESWQNGHSAWRGKKSGRDFLFLGSSKWP